MKARILAIALTAGLLPQAASALVIGLGGVGSNINTITAWLNSQGHTASVVDATLASSFVGLDVYVSVRDVTGNASIISNVSNFVNAGGGLVTEWQGTDIIMQMTGGTSIGNNFIGTGTTIDINGTPHPVTAGVSDFASGAQTEFNYDTNIVGTGLTLLGTIAGQNAIMVGTQGAGRMVGLSWDWQDSPWAGGSGSGSADMNQLILQAIGWAGDAAAVPEPATLLLSLVGIAGLARSRRRAA